MNYKMISVSMLGLSLMAASASVFSADKVSGSEVFNSKCVLCHSYGQGDKIGPDLKGVTKKRQVAWLKKWIKNPESMLKSDPIIKDLLKKYNNIPMTNLGLTDAEVNAVVSYLQEQDKK